MNDDKPDKRSQSEKFKDAAHEHRADEDEAHWEERLRRIAKRKRPDSQE